MGYDVQPIIYGTQDESAYDGDYNVWGCCGYGVEITTYAALDESGL